MKKDTNSPTLNKPKDVIPYLIDSISFAFGVLSSAYTFRLVRLKYELYIGLYPNTDYQDILDQEGVLGQIPLSIYVIIVFIAIWRLRPYLPDLKSKQASE